MTALSSYKSPSNNDSGSFSQRHKQALEGTTYVPKLRENKGKTMREYGYDRLSSSGYVSTTPSQVRSSRPSSRFDTSSTRPSSRIGTPLPERSSSRLSTYERPSSRATSFDRSTSFSTSSSYTPSIERRSTFSSADRKTTSVFDRNSSNFSSSSSSSTSSSKPTSSVVNT